MSINISTQHCDAQNDLKEYINEKLSEVIDKYIGSEVKAAVHFNKNNHYHFHCGIVIHEGVGRNHNHHSINSDGECDEIFSAFDVALNKLSKQLRKYKSKLKNNHNHPKLSETIEAKKYIINTKNQSVSNDDAEIDINLNSDFVVDEQEYKIMSLSLSEAIMKMDLENVPALVFKNSSNECLNMIYRKKDGRIALVDSKKVL